MPSHLHLICSCDTGATVSDIIRYFKKHTSRTLLKKIKESPESRREWLLAHFKEACAHLKRNQQYQVWQLGDHPEELYSRFIYQKAECIHNNPVTDGVVRCSEDYVYSSGPVYAGEGELLEVVCIPQRLRTESCLSLD